MPLLLGMSELLGEPALQPQRRQLGGKLDDQYRIGEAPKRLGAIDAAGNEEEGQARQQANR